MQLLVIKIHDLDKPPEYALLGKKHSQDTFKPSNWKDIRSQTRGRKVLIVLPSNDVVLTSVIIPSKNRKQLLQAIPYSLEDTFAEDIDDLHFAVHQETNAKNNESQVAVINRKALFTILELLKSNRITAHFVLPEVLIQKIEDDAISIIYENNNEHISASVRLNKYQGFFCDQKMLDLFISEQIDEQLPSTIFANTKAENLPEALQDSTYNYIEADTIQYDSTISALPLNLLTNLDRRNDQAKTINWMAWKPVVSLGGVLASIWIGIFFWQNNLLQKQSDQFKQQIEQVYKNTFPKGRIVDAPVQMNSALSKLKTNTGQTIESPLPLIADIGPLFKEYKDMVLSELRYQENQLSMTIESPNLTRLESFKSDAAKKRSLKIEIKDSTTTSNKVKAVILISILPNKAADSTTTRQNKQEAT